MIAKQNDNNSLTVCHRKLFVLNYTVQLLRVYSA